MTHPYMARGSLPGLAQLVTNKGADNVTQPNEQLRKQQISNMTRKELNAHTYLCEKEQEEYERELQQLREDNKQLASDNEAYMQNLDHFEFALQQTREELEDQRARANIAQQNALNKDERMNELYRELEQVKAERDKYLKISEKSDR